MRGLFLSLLVLALASCGPGSRWSVPASPIPPEELAAIAPSGQLSGIARPAAYRVHLDLDPRQARFSGTVSIDVKLEVGATGLWMHGRGLDVSRATVTAGGETVDATWTEVLETGVVRLGFPRRLKPGYLTVDIDYSASFDTNLAGLFRVVEQGDAYVLAKSESIQARKFLPGFDEPGFKAPFDMSFTIPAGMTAIANTPEVSREPAREGFERVTFARSRPLSTYLLSVAVGPFDRVDHGMIPANSVRKTPVPLTGYARRGKGAELDYILSITPELVRIYEEAFQQPYPYRKLDLVAAPQWPSAATELASAITYRESRILVNANSGSAFLHSLKGLHAHELAHMWLGDLVTPSWWNDLWLKEGFADWGEKMALSRFEPHAGHETDAVAASLRAMRLDSLASVRAVSEPIDRNEDIRNAYDAITYSKSLGIIRMADSYFTPDVFRPAVGDYIARFADGTADSEDFFRAIGRSTGSPGLAEAFESFVTQTGVPVLSADLRCDVSGAHVVLAQSRYRPAGSSIDPDARWIVPVCVSWQEGSETGKTCGMMRQPVRRLFLAGVDCPDMIHPNADGAGYYRFSLTGEGWRALVRRLPGLPATEVLTATDSAIASFEAGTLDAGLLLDILDRAGRYGDESATDMVLDYYEALIDRVAGTGSEAIVRARAAALVNDLRAGQEAGAGSDELAFRLDRFAALTLEDPDLRAALLAAVETFLDSQAGLSSDAYGTALTVALADGGDDMLNRIIAARETIDDPVFGQAVAESLGTVRSESGSARVLQLISSGALGSRETYVLAHGQMMNDETREQAWQWLQANMPAFLDAIPSQWRRRVPRLARGFCDTGRIAEVDALFGQYGNLAEGHERALAETRESITLCAALKAATQERLDAAFPD